MASKRTHHHGFKSGRSQRIAGVRNRQPRFSIAIATRNYGQWLGRCLESILRSHRQSGSSIEIVVVDDCSTDNTRKILARYRERYPDIITSVSLATSHGVSAAKNAAIRHCRGEYIALLDADDEFTSDKLARCDEVLKAQPDTELLTHDYTFIDETTGETFVPGNEWYRSWRPPGVWVFRSGRVLFSEQMICGYEELEWSRRFWYDVRRFHVPEPLTIVHGEQTSDRWKIDRAIAGLDGMERWDRKKKNHLPNLVFACRGCGNQYFNSAWCCGYKTERVPLVHYMAVSSFPYQVPVEFSIVVLADDNLTATRSLCADLIKEFEGRNTEIIFVRCHPARAVLDYFRKLSQTIRVKAVFAPPDHAFVYGHDVNRAARAADGRYLLLLDSSAKLTRGSCCSSLDAAFSDQQVGIVSAPPPAPLITGRRSRTNSLSAQEINYSYWAVRLDRFWQMGAIDERFEQNEATMADLQRRARKQKLRPAFVAPANR